MEPEKRNKTKWYLLTYFDGQTPAKVVHGWPAVISERGRAEGKVSARGFHTQEVAERYRRQLIVGSVSFQTEKPQSKLN